MDMHIIAHVHDNAPFSFRWANLSAIRRPFFLSNNVSMYTTLWAQAIGVSVSPEDMPQPKNDDEKRIQEPCHLFFGTQVVFGVTVGVGYEETNNF